MSQAEEGLNAQVLGELSDDVASIAKIDLPLDPPPEPAPPPAVEPVPGVAVADSEMVADPEATEAAKQALQELDAAHSAVIAKSDDERERVLDMTQVIDTVLAAESIDRSDARRLREHWGEQFDEEMNENEYTQAPSRASLPEAKRFVEARREEARLANVEQFSNYLTQLAPCLATLTEDLPRMMESIRRRAYELSEQADDVLEDIAENNGAFTILEGKERRIIDFRTNSLQAYYSLEEIGYEVKNLPDQKLRAALAAAISRCPPVIVEAAWLRLQPDDRSVARLCGHNQPVLPEAGCSADMKTFCAWAVKADWLQFVQEIGPAWIAELDTSRAALLEQQEAAEQGDYVASLALVKGVDEVIQQHWFVMSLFLSMLRVLELGRAVVMDFQRFYRQDIRND